MTIKEGFSMDIIKNNEDIEENEIKRELDSQYYNVMGCLLFKQDYIDAVNQKDFDKLIYFVMRLNVSDTH
jgi:hypothetical protein